MVIPVLDAADPRLDLYRAIRERDLVGRARLFIAEGEVVLRTLLTRSRFPAESLCLVEAQARRLMGLIGDLPPTIPVYVVPRAVMDGIAGFPIHRGILAIGRRGPEPSPAALLAGLPERALVVGLVGLANHDNVGGVFRNLAAFGADAVLLDRTSCDPLYRKAIRVSVGASLMVPFVRGGDADSLVDALKEAGFDVVALSPAGSVALHELAWSPRTALLLGAEGEGLPSGILERVRTVSVPMADGFDSLNVATTSGIALYEARRAAPAHGSSG
jgi:tRNA G18 (ribose-2'-O)-methylase SpoU